MMLCSPGAYAEIYKWVDQKGVTNYSSTPPATGTARTLDPEAAMVSVYQAPPPQDAARLDAMMRRRVAVLENQLQAERWAQQAYYQSDEDLYRLAYEQCLKERRVDCDSGGMRATFYTGAFLARRPFLISAFPLAPFPTPMAPLAHRVRFGSMVSRPAGHSMRNPDHHGKSSRKF